MKKAVLFLAVAIVASASAAAQEEAVEKTHTVVKGDTLWDLSGTYLKDPFKWQEIWGENPNISNPHLIYPGQVIIIRPLIEKVEEKAPPAPPVPEKVEEVKEEVRVEAPPKVEEKAPEAAPAPPVPPKKTFPYPGIEAVSFIVPDGVAPLGKIIDSKEDKVMLSSGDEVYIDLGEDKGAKEGERYSIYRRSTPVYHPLTKKLVGHLAEIIGTVEIERVHERLSEAMVTASYDAISRGDRIVRLEPLPSEIEVRKGAPVDGLIIANGRGSNEMAEGDIVFLDRGKRSGVEAGNTLLVSISGRETEGHMIPPEDVGRLLVLTTQEETSTALVISSRKPFHIGDRVRME
jgi:LysM repeat protein